MTGSDSPPEDPGAFPFGAGLLFCPGDRPDRYAKAAARADAVILDLEDAVAPADKPAAREAVAASRLDPERTLVRVNPAGTADFAADLAALSTTAYRTLMLPKAQDPGDVRALAGYGVVALCETAAGVLHAAALAAEPNTLALMWGAEDLIASLGGTSSREDGGAYRAVALHARSAVLLAAAAQGKAAVDAVYLDLEDAAGLEAEARDAAASGFAAKACIHPGQVGMVRAAFAPDPAEAAAARALLDAAAGQAGVFRFNGRMVDEPLLRHARAVLRRAGHSATDGPA
ncbi:CoA ester lyase [Zafaria cholistanensis]|uniref:CoA ester lyase n=1 Tax=Zafaria cholistanensis TaxID=1682741 RepID=A0A5A7NQZ5_9MICC|nr:aldolase/citrate lyase family protein [Zafaria cholistanensis]GER22552.1 CoA ester lyase [Zafaria cholistanensis]